MGWHDRLVYYRDFAYSTPRLRMANGNIGQVPAATFAELLSGPMIDVYVGEARRRWTLHRNLLCHHSAQLEAELEGHDALELPAHDPAGFELLVKWLYQGRLDDVADLADAQQKYEHAVRCHALYLLCARFDMPQLKNTAMDQFRKGLNEAALVPDADEIDDLYRRSPAGSPFRRLLVRIAARQIMDPDSDRDIESYRPCVEHSADFALELVRAIREGTGGLLLDDPTAGRECDYHDHEDGPHCNLRGKAKAKQARKANPTASPPSARSAASTSCDPPRRPPRPPPPSILPPPPPRQPRPGSSADGLLRRRLTSPASSTVGTSTETAVASHPPSPDPAQDRATLKRAIAPERQGADAAEAVNLPAAPAEHRPSSEDASRLGQPSETYAGGNAATNGSLHQQSPRRGIWEWARAGTGRLGITGRLPHPEQTGSASASKAEGVVANGAPEHRKTTASYDDFDVLSTTAIKLDNIEKQELVAAAKIEGLGISNLGDMNSPNDFSQTKRSSDDLIANASETTGSPSPSIIRHEVWTNGDDTTPTASNPTSPTTPDTPTRPQRRSDSIMEVAKPNIPQEPRSDAERLSLAATEAKGAAKPGQRRIPTYKIALTSSLLSPARRSASAAH